MADTYPFVVVGSGLVGLLTAIGLAKKSEGPVVLIDDKNIDQLTYSRNPLDLRTLALNQHSIEYLTELGLWFDLNKEANVISHIEISEYGVFGHCRLSADTVNASQLGAVISIQQLVDFLSSAVKKYPNIHYWPNTKVNALTQTGAVWKLELQMTKNTDLTTKSPPDTHSASQNHQKIIQSTYVFIADGTQSSLRNQLSISTIDHDYQQAAIVSVCECTFPHRNIAYERFAKQHILAVLPLVQNRIGTVLTAPQQEITSLLALSNEDYLAQLQKLFGWRLGKLYAIGKRVHYPLKSVIATKMVHEKAILLGNAAHTLNPLGAQGLNLGIRGIRDCLHSLFEKGSLENFAARQLERANTLATWTKQTERTFASSALPTKIARQLALLTLEHSTFAKKRFIRQMMGF